MFAKMKSFPLSRIGLALLSTVGLASTVAAGPVKSAQGVVNIKAGVILASANTTPAGFVRNDSPFVWFNLDRNLLVKPRGWNFMNPHATGSITNQIAARWTSLATFYGSNGPGIFSGQLTKETAAYWEVSLNNISDTALNDYDVLFLPASGGLLSLSPSERGRLQRFMDKGGVLWIDCTGGTADAANSGPLAFVTNVGTNAVTQVNTVSQVMSSPYAIDPGISFNSPFSPTYLSQADLVASGFGPLTGILNTIGTEFSQFEIAGATAGQPTVLSAKVGNGAMLVTSDGAGMGLNHTTVNGGFDSNRGFFADIPLFDGQSNTAAKLAVNAVSLISSFTQSGQGGRRTSYTPIDIGAPLLQEFKDESNGGAVPGAPPIAYKGLVFTTVGNRLYAYSEKPGSDLDFDGNPDDGIQDFSIGRGRDLVWQSAALNGPLSSPAIIKLPGLPNGLDEQVVVVDGNGNLQAFKVFPLDVNGHFTNFNAEPTVGTYSPPGGAPIASGGSAPFAPTVQGEFVYVTDNTNSGFSGDTGRVWIADPRGGISTWAIGVTPNNVLPKASGSVTVGYIPIYDNSGGVDDVVYVPTAPAAGGLGGQTAGIVSIWAATKGEKHPITFGTGGTLEIPTRAGSKGAPIFVPGATNAHGIRIGLVDKNGVPLSVSAMSSLLSGTVVNNGGTLELGVQAGVNMAAFNAAGVTAVTVDYWLDWTNSAPEVRAVVRGAIQLPDDTSHSKVIVDSLALSGSGMLYCVEADPASDHANGSFFAIREEGRGTFKVISRYDLFGSFNMALTNAPSVPVPPTLDDNDGLTALPGVGVFLAGPFSKLKFVSGPSVSGNNVYVKAIGYKSTFGVPCTILMTFAADPALPQVIVPTLQPGYTILQPDPSRSTDPTSPDVLTQLNPNQAVYSENNGQGVLRFQSLASSDAGPLTNIFNESMPIIVRQPGRPDLVIEPSLKGSWSTLQWYSVFHGIDTATTLSGPPVATGNTVFFGGNSITPVLFSGVGNPFKYKPTGIIVGMTGNVSDADPYSQPSPIRPWQHQVWQLKFFGGDNITSNTDILWPQNRGITSFIQFRQRLLQTALGGSDVTNPRNLLSLSAGDGTLLATSDIGVYGFAHADFTVADEGRLGSFDSSGNALWTSDQSLVAGTGSTVNVGSLAPTNSQALVRPTRSYPITSTDSLVVDPGANRIARLDSSGNELRSIDSFVVDTSYVPDGYTTGEGKNFNQPQDVLTFNDYRTNSPYSNAQPLEYWRHYLIADTGNKRLVELVDRYQVDPNTKRPTAPIALGVLYYHSPASLSGKGYDYNTVSRVIVPASILTTPRYIYAASTGTTTPTRVGLGLDKPVPPTATTVQPNDTHDGNGGVILIDGANTQVINEIQLPDVPANVLYDYPTAAFNNVAIPSHAKKLGNVTSVNLAYVTPDGGATELRVMITDASGVYEVAYDGTLGKWVVRWMLPAEAYYAMRINVSGGTPFLNQNPSGFRPMYAKRTAAGTVLVVNGYVGQMVNGTTDFKGEVIELEGDIDTAPGVGTRGYNVNKPGLGFDSLSIRFELPGIEGARGLVAPVFADRR